MKKVFLEELPKKTDGFGINKNKECIDWQKSIGYKVKFIYDEIKGKVEIVDYYIKDKQQFIVFRYKNEIFSLHRGTFCKCEFAYVLGLKTYNYKYQIGEIIKTNTGEIIILEQLRKGKKNIRHYKYKCLVDSNIDYISEHNIIRGCGCNVCCGRKILKGYNDLWTTKSEVAKLLKNPKRGYEITFQSNKYELFLCPFCNYEKRSKVSNITNKGFSCPLCGDGVSYPNKFIRAFFNQIGEEFIPEYLPNWAYIKHENPKLNGKKFYDIYLPNRNEVWEVHGLQHYEEHFIRFGGVAKTLVEEQENDKIKKELAEQNKCKYIVIDARESELEWIKNSILNIPQIKRYNLFKFNWNKCHEFACNNLVKVACNLWDEIGDIHKICKILSIGSNTLYRYLNKGVKLGWCDYDCGPGKVVIQLDNNGDFIKRWKSIKVASEVLQINKGNIVACCRNKRNFAGGFKWIYKRDYKKQMIECQ